MLDILPMEKIRRLASRPRHAGERSKSRAQAYAIFHRGNAMSRRRPLNRA
jgi:hypothetical protein